MIGYPRVFVANISWSADDDEVFEFLNQYADLRWFKLACDADGVSRGFGFAEVTSEEEIATLLELDGAEFMGRRIGVARATEKSRR